MTLTLTSSASWLSAPATVRLTGPADTITLIQHPPRTPGELSAVVRATAVGIRGPLFSMISTVAIPADQRVTAVHSNGRIEAGQLRRVFFRADSGRPFRVSIATASAAENLIAALHQPGGAPILGENGIPGSADTAAAVYDVEGRDVLGGYYETDAVASNKGSVTAVIRVDPSPVGLALAGSGDSLAVTLTSLADSGVAGRLDVGLIGGERRLEASSSGSDDLLIPLRLPGWARRLAVDLDLDPAQWPHFTDFGFVVRGADGRILGKSPVNYARARLVTELPAGAADQDATIVLAPAFAEAGSREHWTARVTVRMESARPTAVALDGGDEFKLPPRGTVVRRAALGDMPWVLPGGFVPLLVFIVESGGITWQWPLPLGNPGPKH